MVELENESFDSICRICLISKTTRNLSPLFELQLFCDILKKKCSVPDMIEHHTPLKFDPEDGKPQKICEHCINSLCDSYNFFELCSESDKVLTEALIKKQQLQEQSDDIFDEANEENDVDFDDDVKAEVYEEEPAKTGHKCPICSKSFRNRNTSRHMLKIHLIDTKAQRCLKCNIQVSVKNIFEHSETEQHISKKCAHCNDEFSSVNACFAHQTSCEKNNEASGKLKKLDTKSKHACKLCSLPFESFQEAFDHFLKMHKADNVCMLGCGKTYNNTKYLTYHIQVWHGKKIGCRNCILAFENQNDFKEHCKSNEHNNICDVCNKKFELKSAFNSHKESHESYKFKCEKCAAVYMRANNLKRHIKRDHEGHRYLCQECGKSFTLNYLLEEHIKAVHGEKCNECGIKVAGTTAIHEHKKIHKKEGNSYENICIKCKKSFETEEELYKHTQTHKQLKCETCGESFILQVLLNKHTRVHHKGFKYKYCAKCQKEFESTRDYFRHINTEHKKFQCDMCNKSFTNKYLLRYHIKTHTEGFKHNCEYCGRGFLRKLSLDDHVRTHTGQKPYLCNICGKGFKQKTHLRSHLNSHADMRSYNCRYCEKKFVQHSSWVCHERIHTGEKPYVCPVCNKGFYHSSTMKKHVLTHSETKKGVNKSLFVFGEPEIMNIDENN